MPVTFAEVAVGTALAGGTSVTSSSLQGGIAQAYVAFVGSKARRDITAVSGGGLTWTERKDQPSGRSQTGISVWTAFGSPAAPFTVTAQHASATDARLAIAVARYTGADPEAPFAAFAAANTLGADGAGTGGTDNTAASLTLPAARAGSRLVAAVNARGNTVTAYDVDYAPRGSARTAVEDGQDASLFLADREQAASAPDVCAHTLSAATDWSMAGLAVQAAPPAPPAPPVAPVASLPPRPELTGAGERVYGQVEQLAPTDQQHGWAMAHLSGALATMLDRLYGYAHDADVPWGSLFDAEQTPDEALEHVGQYVGVRLPGNLTGGARRTRVRETDGQRRGTVAALIGAAKQHLTGSQRVEIVERDGSAYRFTVTTFTSETPDPARVLAALLEQKPAGLVLNYQVRTGQSYAQAQAGHATYDAGRLAYRTYADAENKVPAA